MIAGFVLGSAELCKLTLLIFYPLFPLLWIVYRLPELRQMEKTEWLHQATMLSCIGFLSLMIINLRYSYDGTFTPLDEYRFRTTLFTGAKSPGDVPSEGGNRFAGTLLGRMPVPLPADFVQGIDTQRLDFECGQASYLHGVWSDRGWWYFYLYALAVKIPLGTWALFAIAIAASIFVKEYSAEWRDEMVVLMPMMAIIVLLSSQSGFSIHSRYAIPTLPFLFIWTSKAAHAFETRGRAMAALVGVAVVWSMGSSLFIYPHSISYFNEITGGPKNGPEHLLDSNTDWGQDLFT